MGEARAILEANNVHKRFANRGQSENVLENISLHVQYGEIVSILGKSGCGKSTLLNIVGGFEQPNEGEVVFDGETVRRPSRKCVMLFQDYGLLPWRSVLKNVEFGLEDIGLHAKERREKAMHYIKLVGLEDKKELFPRHLSGGMKQRVAIARALAPQPEMILMDEPFAALDTFNRYHLQNELLRIQKQEQTTMILVTHDIDEAIYLSDRIMIMSANPGRVQKEIAIKMAKPRDRSHSNFQYYRRLIFDQFQFNQSTPTPEYNI